MVLFLVLCDYNGLYALLDVGCQATVSLVDSQAWNVDVKSTHSNDPIQSTSFFKAMM